MRWKRKPEAALKHVHIIGAGLSGLAAGLSLKDKNIPHTLYEAAPYAGGRCRSYEDSQLGRVIDNGNHLILHHNKRTLNYISRLKSFGEFYAPHDAYHFYHAKSGQRQKIRPPFIPGAIEALRLWQKADEQQTVASCFPRKGKFYREFIEPFCVAALNTHPNEASATMLRGLLWRTALPGAARYYQIRSDFNRALIDPALKQLDQIHFHKRVKSLKLSANRVTALEFTDGSTSVPKDEAVILALPPDAAQKLLPHHLTPPLSSNAIINGHFLIDTEALRPRLLAITGSPLHWIFLKERALSTTTSHAEQSSLWEQPNIAEILWQEIGKTMPVLQNAPLPPHRIITEKRATYAATPENLKKRPQPHISIANLRLAGDWLTSPLPACIERAIQSGESAVESLLISGSSDA